MHIPDPTLLPDDVWAEKIGHLKIIRKMEADAAKS